MMKLCSFCPAILLSLALFRESDSLQHPAKVSLDPNAVSWLHVPKTGTSFCNTLYTYACPELPNDFSCSRNVHVKPPRVFLAQHNCTTDLVMWHVPFHSVIVQSRGNDPFDWDLHKGNFVTMLRQPEQRIMAGFRYTKGFGGVLNATQYAKQVAGCAVKMMNGYLCAASGPGTFSQHHIKTATPDATMLAAAIHRLDRGFAFVGLTEKWELSVCLFHAMFGGRCHTREFLNNRVGQHDSLLQSSAVSLVEEVYNAYDLSALEGVVDEYDGALYLHAKQTFHQRLKKYNVDASTCAKNICSSVPEQFEHLH